MMMSQHHLLPCTKHLFQTRPNYLIASHRTDYPVYRLSIFTKHTGSACCPTTSISHADSAVAHEEAVGTYHLLRHGEINAADALVRGIFSYCRFLQAALVVQTLIFFLASLVTGNHVDA